MFEDGQDVDPIANPDFRGCEFTNRVPLTYCAHVACTATADAGRGRGPDPAVLNTDPS